jgi:hypothetical protein
MLAKTLKWLLEHSGDNAQSKVAKNTALKRMIHWLSMCFARRCYIANKPKTLLGVVRCATEYFNSQENAVDAAIVSLLAKFNFYHGFNACQSYALPAGWPESFRYRICQNRVLSLAVPTGTGFRCSRHSR